MSQARADPSRNEIPQEQRPRVLAAAILNNLLRRRQVLNILLQQRRKLQLMGTAAPLTDLHQMRALQHAPVLPNEVQRAHARRCRQHWMRAKKLDIGIRAQVEAFYEAKLSTSAKVVVNEGAIISVSADHLLWLPLLNVAPL